MANVYLSTGERISVDKEIASIMEGQTWSRDRKGTVGRSYREDGKVVRKSLHSLIASEFDLDLPRRGEIWMHLDGDWRNFYRENLVIRQRGQWLQEASPEERKARATKASQLGAEARSKTRGQIRGSTGYAGVNPQQKKFKAMAAFKGKQHYLGVWATPEEAAYAYDAALKVWGVEPVNKVEIDPVVAAGVEAYVSARVTGG